MRTKETVQIIIAIIILAAVICFSSLFDNTPTSISTALIFSVLIIGVSVAAKKLFAYLLDATVEHEIWKVSRYGWKPHNYFKTPVPAGAIVPLFFSIFSLGYLKLMTLLTYETGALKERAARRFGFYSYTEMTDWHNALIGAAGILGVLILSIVSYLVPGSDALWRLAAYYAFWNMIPVSNLDGTQIFFGSRILWSTLAVVTTIFAVYAFMLA